MDGWSPSTRSSWWDSSSSQSWRQSPLPTSSDFTAHVLNARTRTSDYRTQKGRPGVVRQIRESRILYRSSSRQSKNDTSNVRCVKIPTPTRTFSAFQFSDTFGALRTLSTLLWFKVELSKSFHQVIIAHLLYLNATVTISTTRHSCDHLSLTGARQTVPNAIVSKSARRLLRIDHQVFRLSSGRW